MELIKQRLNYLINGNQHGVSIGWILKNNSVIIDTFNFLKSRGHNVDQVRAALDEGRNFCKEFVEKPNTHSYDERFNSGPELASLLYAFVILERPKILIETGVANGLSTNLILRALEKVGGTLHSFDVDPRVKNVYAGKADWRLHILRINSTRNDFKNIVESIENIDFWLHDSNHGFNWQYFEYKIALSKLNRPRSILISDDIDASTAWTTTLRENSLISHVIFDKRKFVGIIEL